MTTQLNRGLRSGGSAATETSSPLPNSPRYIDTSVFGRDETGLTIVEKDGRGIFYPDDSTQTNVIPFNATSKYRETAFDAFARVAPSVSVEALYPHWQETREGAAEAIRLIREAEHALAQADEDLCASDIEILNALVFSDSCLFKSLKAASFNKAFEIVVNFCAWALRNQQNDTRHMPSLAGMCAALRELSERPFVGADRATQIVLELEDQGWEGTSPVAAAFEQALDNDLLGFFD